MVSLKEKNPKKKNFTFFQCNFLVRTLWCFQKKFKKKFWPRKSEKRASKVAHNWPRPLYFTVQPRPQNTAQRPELIFHITKSRDETSVLLSVPVRRRLQQLFLNSLSFLCSCRHRITEGTLSRLSFVCPVKCQIVVFTLKYQAVKAWRCFSLKFGQHF